MRTATLTDVGELTIENRERPEPSPDEVLLEVGATGVCMTDFHMYHGSFAVDTPLVLGHESAGTVAARGAEVTDLTVGDRVAMNPVVPCGRCSACKRSATNLCANNASIGGAGERIHDGAFAEYVRVPAGNVEPIGDLPFEQAALAEPLACCVHGADRSGLVQGDSAALIGAGPIGLMLLQTLRNRGVAPIAVAELDPDRRELAAELGADVVVDPRERDTVEAIRQEIGPVDAGIEVVGKVETIRQAHDLTAKGGNTLIFGVPDQEATIEVSPFEVYFEEVDLRGTFALTRESFERAVTLLRAGRIDAEVLVTDEIGLEEIPEAFDRMAAAEGLKTVVVPDR